MAPDPFSVPLRVRYAECDMQGHVFNAHYLTWFDLAHTELLRAATGMSYISFVQRHGVELVVAESSVRYRAPAHYDDDLVIAVACEEPTTSSLTTRFAVTRDGGAVADGALRHVCVDAGSYKKTPWPDAVREALAPYAGAMLTPSRPT